MPQQLLVQLPLQLQRLQLQRLQRQPEQQELPPVVQVDRDLLALVVRVTRVDLLQLLTPLMSDSPTVAAVVEISGRCGRASG
jgi:hypothetical protein